MGRTARVAALGALLAAGTACAPRWARRTPWTESVSGRTFLYASGEAEAPGRAAAVEIAQARARDALAQSLARLRVGRTDPGAPLRSVREIRLAGAEIVRMEVRGRHAYALARFPLTSPSVSEAPAPATAEARPELRSTPPESAPGPSGGRP